jgi:hypothetical protein
VCAGAKQYQRTHYFRPNGYLINYQGKQIADDCHCYQLLNNHTFVSLGNDPGSIDVSLHYTIVGNTLTFDVVVPDQCSPPSVEETSLSMSTSTRSARGSA